MTIRCFVRFLLLLCVLATPALGVVLDGSIAGDGYGPAASVQTVETQFGDNQSELNAAYVQFNSGIMYLAITGNIEANFNKFNIFIDSVGGGENTITPDTGSGGNNPSNDGWANKYAGFTFDMGFAADYMLINRRGGGKFDFDFNSVGNTSTVESTFTIFGTGNMEGSNPAVGASGIGVAYNNSNVAGVLGGTGPADPIAAQAVQTGLELAIPLSAIGNPAVGSQICIAAHVNGSNHDYLSNQSLAGFTAPQGNLGGDGLGNFIPPGTVGLINLNNFQGNQHFCVTVVPEPSTCGLVGLAVSGLALLRRRK
jgi:hypothetical protein